MIDIVNELRERAESYRSGGPSSAHTALLLERAAYEIEDLRHTAAPFARVAACDIGDSEADADLFAPMAKYNTVPRLTVGDFRRLRSVVEGGKRRV